MGIDFVPLVLGPATNAFAETITVDPVASQPGRLSYQAGGIFTSRALTNRGGATGERL